MSQRELGGGPRPIWLRVAAMLCVLLVGVAGIAQAAHIHGEWLPSSAIQVAAHTALSPALAEDACPLCVAMHSALPVTGFAALLVALLLECNLLLVSTHKPRSSVVLRGFQPAPALPLIFRALPVTPTPLLMSDASASPSALPASAKRRRCARRREVIEAVRLLPELETEVIL